MKRFILLLLITFMAVSVFAETKVSVTQSIRYGNGQFAPMDTPQISLQKALNDGGKVFLRYDFEITSKGFLDCDYVYICLRFPADYLTYTFEEYLRVTTLSGATDITLDLLSEWRYEEQYEELKSSVGRLPSAKQWYIGQKTKVKNTDSYNYEVKEYFLGIPLKMKNIKGNKAFIEFYVDFQEIISLYNYWEKKDKEFSDWLLQYCFNEIPIDITFHNEYESDVEYRIPDEKYVKENGYDIFWIYYTNTYWNTESSRSNRAFTIMVRD